MSHGKVKELGDGELFTELKAAGSKLVVVDFTAQWCPPCKMIAPRFAALSEEYPNVVFLKVDVDRCRSTAQSCGISAMPTFQFYINSKKVAEFSGADYNKLKSYIEQHQTTPSFATPGHTLGHRPAPSQAPPVKQVNSNDPDPVMVKELIEMGFPENRAKKALIIVKNSSSQAAMDWIFENMDKPDIDDPLPSNSNNNNNNNNNNNTSTTSTTTDDSAPVVHDALCDICHKQIIGIRYKCKVCPNYDLCQDCKDSGKHPSDHECVAHEKNIENYVMTPEERALQKKKLDERVLEVRRKKAEDEAKREIEREIARRSSGKEQQASVQKWQEDQIKREAEKARKEKEDELRAKKRIKEKIEQDRLERLAKKNASSQPAAAPAAPTPVAAPAPIPSAGGNYSEVTIQIRLPTGNAMRGVFKPTDSLQVVYQYIVQNGDQGSSFKLSTTYPRKIYTSDELKSTTLESAGLVPNGTLILTK